MHFDIDDRVSLRGFRHEDRQDLVNGMNNWAVTRWLGRVLNPVRLDYADAFFAQDEHLHVNAVYGTAAAACRWHFVTMTG